MNMVVVEYRKVYGNVAIYPVNKNARLLAELAGKKTLSEHNLGTAKGSWGLRSSGSTSSWHRRVRDEQLRNATGCA